MTPLLLFLVGAAALGITAVVFVGGFQRALPAEAGLAGAVTAIVVWAVFAFGALSVDIAAGDGTVVTRSYEALALLGGIGGAAALFSAYKAAIETFDIDT